MSYDAAHRQSIIQTASQAQHQASDPSSSVWVSANAGTGKTRVLTNRILRLLINGAAVTDILAVTYTRAAAAEMRNRLFETLARWAVINESQLTHEIVAMGIDRPRQEQIARSRKLFAHLLDHPTGVRIETVHAFAQSVLRRFPLEAGVQPYFELATEEQKTMMKAEVQHSLLTSNNESLRSSLRSLGQRMTEQDVTNLASQIFNHTALLVKMQKDPEAVKAELFAVLGCPEAADNPAAAQQRLIDDTVAAVSIQTLRGMVAACHNGNTIEQGVTTPVAAWLAMDDDERSQNIDHYLAAMLTTKEGKDKAKFPSAKVQKTHPQMRDEYLKEVERLRQMLAQLNAIDVASLSFDLYVVAVSMAEGYQRHKTNAGLMDFDDLINQTIGLLTQDGGASWVRYKLDRGLQHLLIDEAQDTSPNQWAILSSLAEEFFTSDTAATDHHDKPPRSLFSVGDFKQSIYSFQGARPELFLDQQKHFEGLAQSAQAPFQSVPLNTSFRTTSPILQFVDRLASFEGGLAGLGEVPEHVVSRLGDAGFVEILDSVTEGEDALMEIEPFLPAGGHAASGGEGNPQKQLAQKIVALLQSWIGHRVLPAKGRVMRAGDVLILLRKRGDFADILDRELRLAGLPLAGADRVKLNDDIAVMDLLALGEVMLLPEDDLTLATVLKSPLFGLDEDQLFRLAHQRGEASLIQQLAEFAATDADPAFMDAHRQFNAWLGLAERQTPYEFYRDVLSNDCRRRFIERLGAPVVEVIAEFLDMARDFQEIHAPSLQKFLAIMRQSDVEISRENDSRSSNEIRIMTIHGAKGLEAPVVILPDMLRDRKKGERLFNVDQDGFEWPVLPVASTAPRVGVSPVVSTAKQDYAQKEAEEGNRLLYVALTRAEDGLVIAGFEQKQKRWLADSWYERCRHALESIDEVETRPDGDGLQWITDQTAPVQETPSVAHPDDERIAPDWIDQPAPPEETPPRPLTPSRFAAIDPGGSPSGQGRQAAMLRGSITHRMLELLPGLDLEARDRATARITAPYLPNLISAEEVDAIRRDVEHLMANPDFALIFSADSRAEVPISGSIGKTIINGVIDRLVVTGNEVLIIDFKTGQPPQDSDGLPQSYVNQLAVYRHVLSEIYPHQRVKAGVVFTENASLFWAGDAAMDRAIAALEAAKA